MNPLTIVISVVILVLVFMLLNYLLSDPYTLQNLNDGRYTTTISHESLATNGSTAPAYNFSYSVWFYINDWNYRYGEPKVIFGRMGAQSGNQNASIQGISGLEPCPAVVLGAIQNNIAISLACWAGLDQQPINGGRTVIHTCGVSNIPLQRWVNLIISIFGRTLDVYIDGKLVRTCLLPGAASVNNNSNIYVTPRGGFDGWTSKLQYFPNALNPQDAWNIYAKGYGGSFLNNLLGAYQVQISLLENGTERNTITI